MKPYIIHTTRKPVKFKIQWTNRDDTSYEEKVLLDQSYDDFKKGKIVSREEMRKFLRS
jgi:hypothetical protein